MQARIDTSAWLKNNGTGKIYSVSQHSYYGSTQYLMAKADPNNVKYFIKTKA
ncbi:hypothetical protein TUM4630_24650 [Shewanella algidipiscicola]|uniref:Uncharacterized protein n=1 Tax=Shewanella algidipiscicola TaxID=614070 RepID=A0ABQ4PKJ7_9GAMM|nr:hypothetical protein TUM4630_24650 [Shewanella algidipiscicola]